MYELAVVAARMAKRVLRFAQDDKLCGGAGSGIALRAIWVGAHLWCPILPNRGEGWDTRFREAQVSKSRPGAPSLAMVLALLCSGFAVAQKRPDGTASLSGVVTGGAGATVAVHLEPKGDNPARYFDGYEAVAGTDGRFAFSEIPPGEYRLTVDASIGVPAQVARYPVPAIILHPGEEQERNQLGRFTVGLPADMAGGAVTLRAGEARTGFAVRLSHTVSFCGHVTRDAAPADAWGRKTGPPQIVPADTSINFLHYNPEFGILDHETKFDTDKDGSFKVMDLEPGTYYVRSFETWYTSSSSGTGSFAEATPVVVGADAAAACTVEIQQRLNNSCTTGEVTGEIHSDPAVDLNRYGVTILNRNGTGVSVTGTYGEHIPFRKKDPSGAGESFDAQVCAGEYEVVLSEKQHAGNNLWGDAPVQKIVFDSQHVTVAPGATAHLTLTPHAMASIEGEVRLEDVTREDFCSQCQKIYVSILREGDGEFQTVELSSGNHFDFRNVTPGKWEIFITATRPEGAFLRSVTVDGVTGEGRWFTVPEAKHSAMVVTLSGDMARAAGHASPDVRHRQRWEGEGMRPRAIVAGTVVGGAGAAYTVRLMALGYNPDPAAKLTVETAADGSFHFEGVPPGAYRLRVSVRASEGNSVRSDFGGKGEETMGTPLLFAAGAEVKGLTIQAPRMGSICGRVENADGSGVAQMRIWYRGANHGGVPASREVSADNGGAFRIDGLLADDYFLQTPWGSNTLYLSGDGKLGEANPVHVEEGKAVGCGAEAPLRLRVPANVNAFSASGMVEGELPARLGDRFVAEVEDVHEADVQGFLRSAKLNAEHEFSFENLPNGRYRVKVFGVYGPEPKASDGMQVITAVNLFFEPLRHLVATRDFTVDNANVAGMTLQQLTLPTVTGRVQVVAGPEGWKDFKASDMAVTLLPRWKNGSVGATVTDAGAGVGEFTIGAADAGEYEVRIGGAKGQALNGMYIQSVKVDGKEANPRFIRLAAVEGEQLEVVVNRGYATVNVRVTADPKSPAPVLGLNERCGAVGGEYTVVLLPDPILSADAMKKKEAGDFGGELAEGVFAMDGSSQGIMRSVPGLDCAGGRESEIAPVPPGKYLAIAVKDMNAEGLGGAMLGGVGPRDVRTRSLYRELARLAKPISVRAGETIALELQDQTVEAARIAAQVGVWDEYELQPPKYKPARGGK